MIVKVASDPLRIVGFVYFLLAVVYCNAYLCLYKKNKALGGRHGIFKVYLNLFVIPLNMDLIWLSILIKQIIIGQPSQLF